jgi:hypothetical protein
MLSKCSVKWRANQSSILRMDIRGPDIEVLHRLGLFGFSRDTFIVISCSNDNTLMIKD